MEKEYFDPDPTGINLLLYEKIEQLENARRQILETLKKDGLQYVRGGYIIKAGLLSTETLQKEVAKNGLLATETEIKRALKQIETDPRASVLYAANLLEASCKAYLNHYSIAYEETARTLPALWQQIAEHAKIHPKDMEKEKAKDLDVNDLKMFASGLYKIAEGTMNLRNKKGAAHGHSEESFRKINLKPRHARLAVNAASALAMYILELRHKTS
ncbi:abortive infection family protein [Bartonella tribocorum]|uniref:abortive infection family protein n=1 Tax=Bartonella tribocorum TaxID=85701 RepID=UPI001FDEA654|nr:abortive infection family protein [Bartonella tribocorum]